MFAGTGALGLEAMSRGAAATLFVEKNRRAAEQIEHLIEEFGCAAGRCLIADALRVNYSAFDPFDIVFVDPPFDGPDPADLCTLLEQSGALAEPAWVYIETPARRGLPVLPHNWTMLREGRAGQVCYGLAERSALRQR
jgi:16S rRNA (guanine966-N2)-methyltransferase